MTFVTFEGGDGAGKTTLIARLAKTLQDEGKTVLITHAPGATSIGSQIRSLLLAKLSSPMVPTCELFLFLADRAQHVREVIRPALDAGTVVLCDRYTDSTIAYQGARGFDEKFLKTLADFAADGLVPDLTFYLDLDPALGLKRRRGSHDRIEGEKLAFHNDVRRRYLDLARGSPERFCLLDASRSPEEVYREALGAFVAR